MECINSQSCTDANGERLRINEWRNINWEIEDDGPNGLPEISHGLVKLFDW
jgi:hypothetical protein